MNVAVMLTSQREEVFVYQRNVNDQSAAFASQLESFIWSPVTGQERPADVALAAAQAFTGCLLVSGTGIEHIMDRRIPGADTVSIYRIVVQVAAKGEAPFPPTSRFESGRFLPVRSLVPIAKASMTRLDLHLLAGALGLAEHHQIELNQLDPLGVHVPIADITRRDVMFGGSASQGSAGYFGSPALENATFHFTLRVSTGRPRAKPGLLVVPLDVSVHRTTPSLLIQQVIKETISDSRPLGIPETRIRFAHAPPRPRDANVTAPVTLHDYGLRDRGDGHPIYAVLEAPRFVTSTVVLLHILFEEAHLSVGKKVSRIAVVSGAKAEEEEVEEEAEKNDAPKDRWRQAADAHKVQLQLSWSRLQTERDIASRTAQTHGARARYLESQIMDRSASLLHGVSAGGTDTRSSREGGGGQAVMRSLRVVEGALNVCKGREEGGV